MPCAVFDYIGAFLRNGFAHVDNIIPVTKTITWLPLEPTPTRAGTLRNCSEPSKTFWNQPFGTFRNLPPEPTPAYAGTLRNLPEPSGTCSCDPHQRTPELIWAEDPISLRCWGIKHFGLVRLLVFNPRVFTIQTK